jgi:hypothetical protein
MAANFYHLLGIRSDATERELRLAYRQQAKRFHPDRHVEGSPEARRIAENRMRDLNHAVEVLSDVQQRRAYDEELRRDQERWEVSWIRGTPSFSPVTPPPSPAAKAPPGPTAPTQPQPSPEEAMREAVQQVEGARLDDVAAGIVSNAFQALDDRVLWHEARDEYFDRVISGRHDRTRTTLHIRILPELLPEDMDGVIDYSLDVLQTTTASLLRWEFVYLMIGRTVPDEVAVRRLAGAHNRKAWPVINPLSPRAYVCWVDARDGRVHAPEVPRAVPDVPGLKLRLATLYG